MDYLVTTPDAILTATVALTGTAVRSGTSP